MATTTREQYRDIITVDGIEHWRVTKLHIATEWGYGVERRYTDGAEWRGVGRSFASYDEALAYINKNDDAVVVVPVIAPVANPTLVQHLRNEIAAGRLTVEDLREIRGRWNDELAFIGEAFDGTDTRIAEWRDAASVILLKNHPNVVDCLLTGGLVASLSYSGGSSVPLYLDTEHPASHYGIGALILGPNPDGDAPGELGEGDVLDGAHFRDLRDRFGDGTGAEIVCEPGQRIQVIRALGVPEDEPGII